MIYGANGYTGELIARHAQQKKLTPILGGRSKKAILDLATELDLPYRVFDLNNENAVLKNLSDVTCVLNCAGPFSKTAEKLVNACLTSNTHYLDITGEIEVFEKLHSLHDKAVQSGVKLLPGVGFDVVPTDCLAAMLSRRLPGAQSLDLAFTGSRSVSKGTLKTMIENLHKGGMIRANGKLKKVPQAYDSKTVAFSCGERLVTTIPWGDVSTAFYSTGIPDIRAYTQVPSFMRYGAPLLSAARPLLKRSLVIRLLQSWVEKNTEGPNEKARSQKRMFLWGRVKKGDTFIKQTLDTAEGYQFTVFAATLAVEKVLNGKTEPGFFTPSLAFGENFVLEVPGTTLQDN